MVCVLMEKLMLKVNRIIINIDPRHSYTEAHFVR